jgi:hypothetical protein
MIGSQGFRAREAAANYKRRQRKLVTDDVRAARFANLPGNEGIAAAAAEKAAADAAAEQAAADKAAAEKAAAEAAEKEAADKAAADKAAADAAAAKTKKK